MADEAFALSPISARASQPREEDYEAISDAFMETSRGRWFLTEYAKRNRNADTRMVLDAVARIEESLLAQKPPPPQSGLAQAIAAIRAAVDDARASASHAIDSASLEEALAPVRKGARVIREIAWRLREIGADGRICDLIDSQLSVIDAGCGQIALANPALALSTAFDLIQERIAEFDDDASASAGSASSPPPAPSDETPAAAADDADDEAVLDLIALEMAAPDPSDSDDGFDIGETDLAEPSLALPEAITPMPEPAAAPAQPPIGQRSPEFPYRPAQQPSPQPSHQSSLGATLIANGIVRKSQAPAADPLAPIRRMSQAEKIAFFS